MLFDTLDRPDFAGMSSSEAWDACEAWEGWVYGITDSFSEDKW